MGAASSPDRTDQTDQTDLTDAELRAELDRHPYWYHTTELRPGVVASGEFDLRTIPERLPWVDVRGKRCLDVGTFDGLWAFEMERRGAAEVMAVDVDDPWEYDWPEVLSPHLRGGLIDGYTEGETGTRFELTKRVYGSSVERRVCSIYALDPEVIGTFDVVFCSSLLLHLRDPMAALAALRRVCTGHLMTNEPIDLVQTLRNRKTPVARFDGTSSLLQWWVPNLAAQERMLTSAGFEVVQRNRPVIMPFGGHRPRHTWKRRALDVGNKVLTRMHTQGVLQSPVLAKPVL
jgi:tRNA (mo5U34)-methyltransferase